MNESRMESEESWETPRALRASTLRLMARDAHTLYAYWEITDRKKWLASQHFGCDWSELPKVLRLYDVTHKWFDGHNANEVREIVLTPEADNWYVPKLNANTVYMADYGVYTWERQFVPFLRSNAVRTARDCPAGWGEPIVCVVPEASNPHPPAYIPPYSLENFERGQSC